MPESKSPTLTVQQIAQSFRRAGWIGFWIQVVLSVIASSILLFAGFSTQISATNNNNRPAAGTGFGLVFAVLGLVLLGISIYWAFRYTRMGRQLGATDPVARPRRSETVQMLKVGLVVNLVGMLLTLVGAFALIGGLLAKLAAQPQGATFALNNPRDLVQALDIFVVQANTNIMAGQFTGVVVSLWLLNRVTR